MSFSPTLYKCLAGKSNERGDKQIKRPPTHSFLNYLLIPPILIDFSVSGSFSKETKTLIGHVKKRKKFLGIFVCEINILDCYNIRNRDNTSSNVAALNDEPSKQNNLLFLVRDHVGVLIANSASVLKNSLIFEMNSIYLSEMLSFEDNAISDINLKINEIIQQSNSLKNDIRTIVDVGNINLKPLMTENKQLISKAQELMKDTVSVQEDIISGIKPELNACSLELKTLSKSLQEVNLSLYYLNHLLEIYSSIKLANTKLKNKEFHNCSKLIKVIQKSIKNDVNDLKQLEIFKKLSDEATITYEHLLHQINEFWSTCVSIDLIEKSGLKEIVLSVDVNSTSKMEDVFKALDCLQYNSIEKKFVNMFVNSVINEIILYKVKLTERVNEKAVLTLEFLKCNEKPHYTEVFDNLAKAINFINNYLNVDIQNGKNFLQKIGANIGEELAEKLIKNCLSETIPTSSEDLEKYNSVVKTTEEFEIKLKNFGFLPEKSTCLIDYAKNINLLFANKFCQSYLEKARMLMKKDLQVIASSEEIVISNIYTLPKSHRTIIKSKLKEYRNMKETDEFILPKCQISKAAKDLTELVNNMVNEMLRSQDLCAVRLFYTIRNIFEMYSAVVPLHHKKFLDTLPQQVALLHNNCIYFAHFLINLTCEYYEKIPGILNENFNIFLEEVVLLRCLAVEKLEEHVMIQKKQLIYILLDSGIATLNEDPKLDPNSEKSIRQCMRQLQILQSVWKDVLSEKVYNKAIGFLLDSIMDELITLVMQVEDISSQTATDLASMFSIIIDRAPNLFRDGTEAVVHVKKWLKFKEFIAVLKGNLRDIDDLWSNGAGPLAHEFTAEQVKHLIRALFQNSDRRSALLNRIK